MKTKLGIFTPWVHCKIMWKKVKQFNYSAYNFDNWKVDLTSLKLTKRREKLKANELLTLSQKKDEQYVD